MTASHITLVLQGETHEEDIHFKIRRDVPLSRLFDKYCQRAAVHSRDGLTFVSNGRRVHPNQSSDDLKLSDGDIINVVTTQVGGCGRP